MNILCIYRYRCYTNYSIYLHITHRYAKTEESFLRVLFINTNAHKSTFGSIYNIIMITYYYQAKLRECGVIIYIYHNNKVDFLFAFHNIHINTFLHYYLYLKWKTKKKRIAKGMLII